jgi:hypothetical protein
MMLKTRFALLSVSATTLVGAEFAVAAVFLELKYLYFDSKSLSVGLGE